MLVLERARSSLDGRGENLKRTHKRREEANKKLLEKTEESTLGLDTLGILYKRFEHSQDKLRHKTNEDGIGGDQTPRRCGWCPRCTGRDEKYPVLSSDADEELRAASENSDRSLEKVGKARSRIV